MAVAATVGLFMVVAHIRLALAVAGVGFVGVVVVVVYVIMCCQAARR